MRFYDVTSWSYVNLDDPLDYAIITHSIVGFKPKKFDLVHQTVSPRERVWSGHETNALGR